MHRPRFSPTWRALAVLAIGSTILGVPLLAAADIVIDLGRGPVTVHVPSSYDPGTPAPLVMLLHGYSGWGAAQESYMQFLPLAEEYGFLYLYPDGLVDSFGNRFWNATDACCDFDGTAPDDSAYLRGLLDEVANQLSVDPRRVYVMGHSNGGFMSYRMACDHADLIAAIMSLAGATFADPADCSPGEPVHILQIHGTADTVIRYDGGFIGPNEYPGAVTSVETWATYDGCDLLPDDSPPPLDLDRSIPGAESSVTRYESGCNPGGSGDLWSIQGGAHSPALSGEFSRLVIEYLLAHPKPDPAGIAPILESPLASLGTPGPTPFRRDVQLELHLSRATRIDLSVHDVTGRVVRHLQSGVEANAGQRTIQWDGADDHGDPVAPGVYFVHLQAGGWGTSCRVVHVN